MQVNRDGIFFATIGDHSVAPSGPNKLTTFMAEYRIFEEILPDGVNDVLGENLTITGYHYLEKKDGTLNTHTIDKLKEATGWDGVDPFWLEDGLPGDLVVKITVEFETYNNRQVPKVKWIDHRDATGGGIVRASDAEKTAIRNRLGSKLRAINGGTKAKSAPAPTTAPTMPKAEPAAAPAPTTPPAPPQAPPQPAKRGRPKSAAAAAVAPVAPAAPPAEATQADAWAAFIKDLPPTVSEENVNSEWTRILTAMFPDKGDDDMTPADWAKVRDEAPSQFVPF